MGKTTMLFHLLETFRTSARIAFLFQTHCNSKEFMRLLLAELGCEEDTKTWSRCMTNSTNAWSRSPRRAIA